MKQVDFFKLAETGEIPTHFNTSKTFCFLQVKELRIITMKNARVIINVIQDR